LLSLPIKNLTFWLWDHPKGFSTYASESDTEDLLDILLGLKHTDSIQLKFRKNEREEILHYLNIYFRKENWERYQQSLKRFFDCKEEEDFQEYFKTAIRID